MMLENKRHMGNKPVAVMLEWPHDTPIDCLQLLVSYYGKVRLLDSHATKHLDGYTELPAMEVKQGAMSVIVWPGINRQGMYYVGITIPQPKRNLQLGQAVQNTLIESGFRLKGEH